MRDNKKEILFEEIQSDELNAVWHVVAAFGVGIACGIIIT